jgi:hypothetical protein
MTVTDQDGKFSLYPEPGENFALVALHTELGFGFQRKEQFVQKPELRLSAWAGLECELKQNQPVQDQKEKQFVSLRTRIQNTEGLPDIYLDMYSSELPSEEGNLFRFRHIPSFYSTTITRGVPGHQGDQHFVPAATIELLPDETRQMSFGPLTPQQRAQLESSLRGMELHRKASEKAEK